MKTEVQKKEEEEIAAEDAKNSKKNEKRSRFSKETKADLENDPVVQKALEWLKSDITVKKYKQDNEKQISDTTAMNQ
jgi:hypothetical protein